jgi:hypothetical protein
VATYNIVDKPNKDPEAVTLSRVAACFPTAACQYTMIAENRVVSITEMHSISSGYPLAMMCQHFTSIIPIEKEYTRKLLNAHALYLYYFSRKISSNNKQQQSEKELAESTWKYMNIVYNGSFIEDHVRVAAIKGMDILEGGKLSSAVKRASNTWLIKFGKYIKDIDIIKSSPIKKDEKKKKKVPQTKDDDDDDDLKSVEGLTDVDDGDDEGGDIDS